MIFLRYLHAFILNYFYLISFSSLSLSSKWQNEKVVFLIFFKLAEIFLYFCFIALYFHFSIAIFHLGFHLLRFLHIFSFALDLIRFSNLLFSAIWLEERKINRNWVKCFKSVCFLSIYFKLWCFWFNLFTKDLNSSLNNDFHFLIRRQIFSSFQIQERSICLVSFLNS